MCGCRKKRDDQPGDKKRNGFRTAQNDTVWLKQIGFYAHFISTCLILCLNSSTPSVPIRLSVSFHWKSIQLQFSVSKISDLPPFSARFNGILFSSGMNCYAMRCDAMQMHCGVIIWYLSFWCNWNYTFFIWPIVDVIYKIAILLAGDELFFLSATHIASNLPVWLAW